MKQGVLIEFLIDDKPNLAWTCQLEDEGVYPRDVIRQQEKSTIGQMLQTVGFDSIDEA
jgi:hypothetical protein